MTLIRRGAVLLDPWAVKSAWADRYSNEGIQAIEQFGSMLDATAFESVRFIDDWWWMEHTGAARHSDPCIDDNYTCAP